MLKKSRGSDKDDEIIDLENSRIEKYEGNKL